MSQKDLIVEHCLRKGGISPLEADSLYRIKRLAARIGELERDRGMSFRHDRRTDPTGRVYTRYVML